MSVVNGQEVEASIVNNAFMSRVTDTSTTGKVGLQNVGSTSITDAQTYVNKLAETVGTTETDPSNLEYSSNEVVTNGDSHKVAIGKLDAFSGDLRTDLDALDSREASNNSIQDGQITALDGRVNTIESLDSTFGGVKTFSDDVIVQGNLEVQGALTAINSTELEIEDAFITINKGGSDATSEGAGIEIERTADNAGIVFDSSLLSKFKLGLVTDYSEVLVAAFDQVVTGVKDFVNGFKTDTVSESTLDAGVTVDGVLIKDGLVNGRDISADGSALDSLGGNFSGHIGDDSIHFTESSISHLNIQDVGTNTHAQIDTHIAANNNPHGVTATQVGLGNVTNDAQLTRNAEDFISFSEKSTPGISDVLIIEDSEDSYEKKHIIISELPFLKKIENDWNLGFAEKTTPVNNDLVLIEDSEDGFAKKKVALGNIGIGGGGVTDHTLLTNIGVNTHDQIDAHIASTSNPHSVTKAQIGLGNVDNTSDLDKPISTATKAYVDANAELDRNFLRDSGVSWNGENGTTGFATYKDADAARPVDGTGGTATVTITTSSTNPLSGSASLVIGKPASNVRGEGLSVDFSIDRANQARVLKVEFDYNVAAGTFVAGTTSADSDVIVYLYDVTNNRLIEPSTFKLFSNSTTVADKFSGYFQTSADSLDYRLIFHVTTTSAVAFDLRVDNIIVTPSKYVFGTPITDWQSYTPIFENLGTPTGVDMKWRRVGADVEINGRWANGTVGSGTATFTMPSGLVSNLTNSIVVGNYGHQGTATGEALNYNPVNNNIRFGMLNYLVHATGTQLVTAGITSVKLSVPIQGWSSSVRISDGFEARDVVFVGQKTTSQAVTANVTNITFTTQADTVAGWDGSQYTVPSSGFYSISGWTGNIDNAATRVFVNGSWIDRIISRFPTATGSFGTGTVITYLRSGDTVSLRSSLDGTLAPAVNSSNSAWFLSIHKLQSPQTTAQSEVVAARYRTTAGQNLGTTTLTTIVWGTRDYDSHNIMNTTNGEIIIPTVGLYNVSFRTQFNTPSLSSISFMAVFRNGVEMSILRNPAPQTSFNGSLFSDTFSFVAEDVVTLRAYNTVSGVLATTANTVVCSITKVG